MGNLLGTPVTEKETESGRTADGLLEYGTSSMQGWRVHMEDAHICQPELWAERRRDTTNVTTDTNTDIDTNASTIVNAASTETETELTVAQPQKRMRGGSDGGDGGDGGGDATAAASASTSPPSVLQYERIPLPGHSLFAVFDGHGGTFAAEYAARNLLRVLCRRPEFATYAERLRDRDDYLAKKAQEATIEAEANKKKKKDEADGDDVDDDDINDNNNDNNNDSLVSSAYDRNLVSLLEQSLRDAFVDLDREIMTEMNGKPGDPDANTTYGDQSDQLLTTSTSTSTSNNKTPPPPPQINQDEDSGTTAVAVVLTPKWIACANAGDSRSVYSRSNGRAVPLSYDHKPDDENELRRVKDAGGRVSAGRVEGDLAVSRGFGDFRFKDYDAVMSGAQGENQTPQTNDRSTANADQDAPMMRPGEQMVSPVPDIIVQERDTTEDQFVIIACDGVWDVYENREFVREVADCFRDGETHLGLLCEEMCDLTLLRGSKDNVTCTVVKFPGQAVTADGGGGVRVRRERRDLHNRGGGGGTANFHDGEGGGEEKYSPHAPDNQPPNQ